MTKDIQKSKYVYTNSIVPGTEDWDYKQLLLTLCARLTQFAVQECC